MTKTGGTNLYPGHALRTARIEQGLSLRALAARSGLPYSTLSKLENGKMAMTYDKLLALAQGLNVDLGSLVSAPADKPAAAVGRRSVARANRAPDSDLLPEQDRHTHHYMAADLLGKLMTPVIISIETRDIREFGELVRHSGEEYLYVLSGAMELHSDLYAPLRLNVGDSIYFDSGMAHAYVRVSDEPCHVLSVCAGPSVQRIANLGGAADNDPQPGKKGIRLVQHVSDIET